MFVGLNTFRAAQRSNRLIHFYFLGAMQWLLLGVMALALVVLCVYYPKIAFGIFGMLLLGATLVVFTTHEDAVQQRRQLPLHDIQIETAVMRPAYADSYQFSARLVNVHRSILLKEAVVGITMLDCPSDSENISGDAAPADCTVLGQTEQRVNIQIPPQQARNISRNVSFSGISPRIHGTLRWQYKILETRS